jgi:hypothetical protein
MEDAVRKTCPEIVHDVVVVGQGRAMPVLLAETVSPVPNLDTVAQRTLAEQIVAKMSTYNADRFNRDRVNDPKRILFVDKGSLLRNKEKGNVR